MKKMILCIVLVLIVISLIGCASTSQTGENLIFDANAYSRISSDELVEKMGEWSEKDSWTNKTTKGTFACITYCYNLNGNYYEFIVCDDMVVRVSVYSSEFGSTEGEPFKYRRKNKMDILEMFGITAGDNARKVVDNGFTWRISPVSDTVDDFNVQMIDSSKKTFELVKITYDSNYFD